MRWHITYLENFLIKIIGSCLNSKYNILEVANTHGGDLSSLKKLICEFSHFDGLGMKFQPFYYDEIAAPDYERYNVYKEFYFTKTLLIRDQILQGSL